MIFLRREWCAGRFSASSAVSINCRSRRYRPLSTSKAKLDAQDYKTGGDLQRHQKSGSSANRVEGFWPFLDLREHAGKDLKAQVLLIAQTIGTALKDTDFVVEALDEAE